MSNAIDVTSAFEQASGGTFVSGPEKEQAFLEQTPFYIVNVEPRSEGQYGDQTIYYVKAQKWGKDETRLLAFSHNAYRERQATGVLKLITESGKPGGPVYLGKFRTQSGKDAWTLDAKPFDVAKHQAATPATSEAPKAAAVTDDDSLPF